MLRLPVPCRVVRVVGPMVALWSVLIGTAPMSVPFELREPSEGAHVLAGSTIPVQVTVGPESGTRRVSYYWYREEAEPEPVQAPALTADGTSTPPYGGRLVVPVEAMGRFRLLAVAEVAQGRLGTQLDFDERMLEVESPAAVAAIEFDVEKPWALGPAGKLIDVPAVGQCEDGVFRRFNDAAVHMMVRSSDERVVAVVEGGRVRAMGPGRAELRVEQGGRWATLEVVVSGAADGNRVPRANPGNEQRVKSGARVVLSGVASVDPDGDPLRYEWTQVRGLKVDLVGPDEPTPSFMAPKVSGTRLLRFKLRVTDMTGPDTIRGADSLPAYVNIWVDP